MRTAALHARLRAQIDALTTSDARDAALLTALENDPRAVDAAVRAAVLAVEVEHAAALREQHAAVTARIEQRIGYVAQRAHEVAAVEISERDAAILQLERAATARLEVAHSEALVAAHARSSAAQTELECELAALRDVQARGDLALRAERAERSAERAALEEICVGIAVGAAAAQMALASDARVAYAGAAAARARMHAAEAAAATLYARALRSEKGRPFDAARLPHPSREAQRTPEKSGDVARLHERVELSHSVARVGEMSDAVARLEHEYVAQKSTAAHDSAPRCRSFCALLRAQWRRARRAQLVSGLGALRRESARVEGGRESTQRGAAGAAVLYTVLRQQKKLSASVLHLLARDRATAQTRRVFGRWCSHTARCVRANASAMLSEQRDDRAHALRRVDLKCALHAWRTSARETRCTRSVLATYARRRAQRAVRVRFRLWKHAAVNARETKKRARVLTLYCAQAQARAARRQRRCVVREWRQATRSARTVRTTAQALLRRLLRRTRSHGFDGWVAHVAARARVTHLRARGSTFARGAKCARMAHTVRQWAAIVATSRTQRRALAAIGARGDLQRVQCALCVWLDAARSETQEQRRYQRRAAAASHIVARTRRRVLTTTLTAWRVTVRAGRRRLRTAAKAIARLHHRTAVAGWSRWVAAVDGGRVRSRARARAALFALRLAARTVGVIFAIWRRCCVRRRHLRTTLQRVRAHANACARMRTMHRWHGAARRTTRARRTICKSTFRRWYSWTAQRHQHRRAVIQSLRRATHRDVAALWQAWVCRAGATKLRRHQVSVLQQRCVARDAQWLHSCATAWRRAAIAQRAQRGAASAVVQLAGRCALRRAIAQWRGFAANRRAASRGARALRTRRLCVGFGAWVSCCVTACARRQRCEQYVARRKQLVQLIARRRWLRFIVGLLLRSWRYSGYYTFSARHSGAVSAAAVHTRRAEMHDAVPDAATAAPTLACAETSIACLRDLSLRAATSVVAPAAAVVDINTIPEAAVLEEELSRLAGGFTTRGAPLRSARFSSDVGCIDRAPPPPQSAIGAVQAALDSLARLREEHAALRASPWSFAESFGSRDAPPPAGLGLSQLAPAPFAGPAARAAGATQRYTVVCRGTIESIEEQRGAIGGALSSRAFRQ